MLIDAIVALTKTDFLNMMGSGVLVRLTPITEGREFCEEFCINAEDMEFVKIPLLESLKSSLRLRSIMLKEELSSICDALKT